MLLYTRQLSSFGEKTNNEKYVYIRTNECGTNIPLLNSCKGNCSRWVQLGSDSVSSLSERSMTNPSYRA